VRTKISRLILLVGLALPTCADELRLYECMERFSRNYNQFIATWQKGTFDFRQAKQLSKLWRDIEDSGYWPREAKAK
jgi:hypothetical protein